MLEDEEEINELLGRNSPVIGFRNDASIKALLGRLKRLFSRWILSTFRQNGPSRRFPSSRRYPTHGKCKRSLWTKVFWSLRVVATVVGILLGVSILRAIIFPSYQNPPAHYRVLRNAVTSATHPGRGNPNNEKIFIAANIVKEDLIRGAWGNAVLDLVKLLGEENVFLSIYENDSGSGTADALQKLKDNVRCNTSIVTGDHLSSDEFPTITLPSGEKRVKRIAYLAEVRNRALRPLDPQSDSSDSYVSKDGFQYASNTYDRILFINDVYFSPISALQLLFSTNLDSRTGRPSYRAACGIDFWRYAFVYDTFAIRDLGGSEVGLGLFPWFLPYNSAESRQDVLAGTDAVRVKSCWSGIVAFDAAPFQTPKSRGSDPMAAHTEIARYRYEPELFIEASECCLIHADLIARSPPVDESQDTGIYINPFVRVAYEPATFSWIPTVTRYERLFAILQNIVSRGVPYPAPNPRRNDRAGTQVMRNMWSPYGFEDTTVTATPGGYCAWKALYVMVDMKSDSNLGGKSNWQDIPVAA